jgi:hypothetical protein
MDWYEEIEEPIRGLVKLLRENGFNTECSCGHEMYVQCQCIPDGVLQRLHNLLYNNDYRDYKIDISLECINGCWRSTMNITIPKENPNAL